MSLLLDFSTVVLSGSGWAYAIDVVFYYALIRRFASSNESKSK